MGDCRFARASRCARDRALADPGILRPWYGRSRCFLAALASPLRVTPDGSYELWKDLRRRDVRILRREELLERIQKRKQALARTGTLGPVSKTLALAEPLCYEQLELLQLKPGVSASEVEADSRIFIPYIRLSDGT